MIFITNRPLKEKVINTNTTHSLISNSASIYFFTLTSFTFIYKKNRALNSKKENSKKIIKLRDQFVNLKFTFPCMPKIIRHDFAIHQSPDLCR